PGMRATVFRGTDLTNFAYLRLRGWAEVRLPGRRSPHESPTDETLVVTRHHDGWPHGRCAGARRRMVKDVQVDRQARPAGGDLGRQHPDSYLGSKHDRSQSD